MINLDTAYTVLKLGRSVPGWLGMVVMFLRTTGITTWLGYALLIPYPTLFLLMLAQRHRLEKYAPLGKIMREASRKDKEVRIYLAKDVA